MKNIDTLISDIYDLLENGVDTVTVQRRDIIHSMSKEISRVVTRAISEGKRTKSSDPKLRMSQIGKPHRQLWYDMQSGLEGEEINGQTKLKFLYGEILEALLIGLSELAGHSVTEKQQEVSVEGIVGHKDCRIDGVLVDIKSASPYAFKKFKEGTLHSDDPFGYIAQISGYAEAGKDNQAAFFAVDKSSAELTLMKVEPVHMINATDKIKTVKKMVSSDAPPPRCYDPEPDGTSGNKKLAIGCVFCPYKFTCWSDANGGAGIRSFKYSNGVRHLVQVSKTPNVEEITNAA